MRVNELKHCLTSLSEAQRSRIAGFLDLNEKHLLDVIEQKLTDPGYYQDQLNKMDRKTRKWFFSLFFSDGKIKKQTLYQDKNLPLSKVDYRRLLNEACRRGWVYCLRNRHRELIYYTPFEIRVAWAGSILQTLSFTALDEEDVIPVKSNPLKVSQAFFHFLVSLSQDPWRLNRTGQISKKDVRKMDVELDMDDVHDAWPGWSLFLLKAARLLLLTKETNKQIGVCQIRWKSFLNLSWQDSIRHLYDAVRHVLLKDHAGLDGYCLLLEQLPPETWWSLEDIRRRIKTEHPVKVPKELIQRLQDCFLIPMACMGWLEWGKTAKGDPCFKWLSYPPRKWEHPGELPVYTDPAPEIYIPYHFPLKERHELSLWADFMGGDHLIVYEINEKSLSRGLQYGWTLDKIKEKLEEWTGDVPPLFMERVRDLYQQMNTVSLSVWTCLKLKQKTIHTNWPHRLKENGWEVKRWSETEYFVKETPKNIGKWLHNLNQEAIIEKKEESLHEMNEKKSWEIDVEGVLNCRAEWPEPEKIDLPKAWFTGSRAYGINMAKEIVRQSISHGLPLILSHQGEEVEVHPERLRYESGKWVLEGMVAEDRRKICLNEVDKFQMLPSSSV